MAVELPVELAAFIEKGGTVVHSPEGDWDLDIRPGEGTEFEKAIPKGAVVIAENGCGDCLFLKMSKGKLGEKVFVFLHEENRTELFAKNVSALVNAPAPAVKPPLTPQPPAKTVSLADLEKVVMDPKRGTYRTVVLERFKEGSFGLDALPLLRRILDIDDIFLVLHTADCIATLGALVKESADYEDLQRQLRKVGSKVWDYSGLTNAFGGCLEALYKIEADATLLIRYIEENFRTAIRDDFVEAMKVLGTIEREEAKELLKRAAGLRQGDLNLKQRKSVDGILKAAGVA